MRKYAEDYEIIYEDDGKGGEKKAARYIGQYFEIDVDQASLVKFKRNSLVLTIVILLLHIAGGFIGNRSMYSFYIVLPYVFSFLPIYFLADGILRIPKEKKSYRRDEAELSFKRMKKASIFLLIFLSMTVVGEIIYIIFFTNEWNSLEFLFLSLVSLAAVASYILIRIRNTINVREIDVQK